MRYVIAIAALLSWPLAGTAAAQQQEPATGGEQAQPGDGFRPVQEMLDISGLAWLADDTFLVVHDAKNPDELERVRISLLKLPASLEGLLWKPLEVAFPGEPSSDLESAARIPGSDQVLLVESSDSGSKFNRIFLADAADGQVKIVAEEYWSSFTSVFNVEGAAVAGSDGDYIFIWAERASGEARTAIRWSPLSLDPFKIGPTAFSATFVLPDNLVDAAGKPLYSRPVVGIDVGEDRRIYTLAAYDPEDTVENPDNGPFRGAVFAIGRVEGGEIELDPEPRRIATIDGFKPESIVVRDADGRSALFMGTDDENYGGTLRELPPVGNGTEAAAQ